MTLNTSRVIHIYVHMQLCIYAYVAKYKYGHSCTFVCTTCMTQYLQSHTYICTYTCTLMLLSISMVIHVHV